MNLGTFDMNLLRIFDALMREHSTVRAGVRLGLSQPAVSAALGRLRYALSDELFVRNGNRMVPTERATRLEAPVRELLHKVEGILAPPQFEPATAGDVFRIACLDYFDEMLLPDLLAELAVAAPGVRIQHLDLPPGDNLEALRQCRVDLALLPEAATPEGMAGQTGLFRAPFVVVARSGHPRLSRAGVVAGAEIPLDLYCDLRHVLCSPDGRLRGIADEALAALGRRREVVASVPNLSGAARIVADSDMLALLPAQYARAVAERLALSIYQPPFHLKAPVIGMYWHRAFDAAPSHRWLRQRIAAILEAQDIRATGPAAGPATGTATDPSTRAGAST